MSSSGYCQSCVLSPASPFLFLRWLATEIFTGLADSQFLWCPVPV